METLAEMPGKASWVPVAKLEEEEVSWVPVGAWRRSDCHGSSPLLLGLRERRATILVVEDEERESSNFGGEEERFSGCGTEKKEKLEI